MIFHAVNLLALPPYKMNKIHNTRVTKLTGPPPKIPQLVYAALSIITCLQMQHGLRFVANGNEIVKYNPILQENCIIILTNINQMESCRAHFKILQMLIMCNTCELFVSATSLRQSI